MITNKNNKKEDNKKDVMTSKKNKNTNKEEKAKENMKESNVIISSYINDYRLTVSVAESVTAGALSNTICSEPGSSRFFLGGIVAYNMKTQKELLNVDEVYAEENGFANPFTTLIMAKNVTSVFQSRIGLSTTGFSLPMYREKNEKQCELKVNVPYAYVCIYDAKIDYHKIYKIVNTDYKKSDNQKLQRAQMQSKVALECKKIYENYCLKKK